MPNGTASPPPTAITPPTGYEFADEWKIDVTGVGISRDELGWEYSWDNRGGGRRRRRWLRKLRVVKVKVRDAADILREQREKEKGREGKDKKKVVTADKKKDEEDKRRQHAEKGDKKVESAPSTSARRRRKSSPIYRAIRPIRDNWNFKGCGVSVVKSLMFPSSGGISVRLPLSINFDWYERRPELPSITSSAGYYYSKTSPWTYAVFLNASLPMELVRFFIRRFGEYGMFLGGVLWSILMVITDAMWRVLMWPASVLVRFATLLSDMALNDPTPSAARSKSKRKKSNKKRKKKATDNTVVILGHSFPRLPAHRSIVYSTSIQDRVGVSASWRISARNGYEFRISYWHVFLPTMLALAGVLGRAAGLVMPQEKTKIPMKGRVGGDLENCGDDESTSKVDLWQKIAVPCEEWVRRRTGSLGVSWGGPIPESPFWSASALLSLSGFYPREVTEGLRKSMSLLSLRGTKQYGVKDLVEDNFSFGEARLETESNTLSRGEIEDAADDNEEELDLPDSEDDQASSKLLAAVVDDESSSSDEADVAFVSV